MSHLRSPDLGAATLAIHSQQQKDAFGSSHIPIYETTTFTYPGTAALLEVTEGHRRAPLYSRYGHPPLYAL
ncbi:PLP-dependent transferase [Halomonas sp. QX-2]|uniref:PLP-dependent transferase n=1 Tax=Vreelandella sedimenti TaxID=2729618 RepID=A0A7Z0SNA3_9GAMM|nr:MULTISPECIES: PLP-dependent transferase [Halomonas]NYT72756.1 PLP-dependent transferase [Halomonas sedimenti]